MCGITGHFFFRRAPEQASSWLAAAVRALDHRGPDGRGVWEDGRGVGLGHARLSILDLGPSGRQPMQSQDGRWVMVFNGEVYNFAELRRDLEQRGARFRGSGDAEVVLESIAHFGLAAIERFIGMFAIALWDTRDAELHLIRDRLGVKPLYYGLGGGAICFASELKAMREYRHRDYPVALDGVADYLRYGYIGEPLTVYRDVWKLPAGHRLRVASDGSTELTRYWSVLDAASSPLSGSEEALADQLEALLTDACRLRMIADVPVGVFLSGGVDSSMLAALLSSRAGGPALRTFTVAFAEPGFDESQHAARVSRHLASQHVSEVLSPHEALRLVPRWGELYDEPFADSSGLATLLLSRVAARSVKVALSADGGDELFGGYGVYGLVLRQQAELDRMSPLVRRLAGTALGSVPWWRLDDALALSGLPAGPREWLRNTLPFRFAKMRERLAAASGGAMYDDEIAFWRQDEIALLLRGGGMAARPLSDRYPGCLAERLCLWDLHHYLPGDILTKVDRATMSASLEGREPLLDHRLVEFAFRLPMSLRRGALGPKHLLRRVLYRHVPRPMIERPKHGFRIPLERWLRGELRPLVDHHLSSGRVREAGLFEPAMVERLVRRFSGGDARSTRRVWTLLGFQLWHERWAC